MTRRDQVIEAEVENLPRPVQDEFRRIVGNGNTREFALMAVSRAAPVMGNCDRAFCEHQHNYMTREVGDMNRKLMVENARKAGISTEGKTYCGFIGQYDDPMAWVSGREDAVAACKAKGISTDGTLKVKSPRKEQAPTKRFLAADLVEDQAVRILKSEPKTLEKFKAGKLKKEALRERVRAEHGPPR